MAANSLRDERGAAATELSSIMDGDDLTDDQFTRAEHLDASIQELDTKIEARKTAMAERASTALAKPVIEVAGSGGMVKASDADANEEFYRWFRSAGRYQSRDLTIGNDPQTIPQELSTEMIAKLAAVSSIRQCSAISVVNYLNDTDLAAVNARLTVGRVGEAAAYGESEPTFRDISFKAFKSAVMTDLSDEWIADSRPPVVAEVLQQQAEGHGLYWEGQYATSNGYTSPIGGADVDGGQPEGIMVSPTQYAIAWDDGVGPNSNATERDYVTTSVTTKVESLIKAVDKDVPAQYWAKGGAWIMGQDFYADALALVDSTGRPLFQPNAAADLSAPLNMGTLLGRPVFVTSQAPTVSTKGDVHAVYVSGDTYRIADRGGFTSLFDPYTVSSSGLVRYLSQMRSDARFLTAGFGVSYLVKE
tara:strand:+ start:565 stop:1818 length:1254 start_codon:yes stop_codon:yes gene_type:complete